jgi:RNA polymerase sigma-70 factor (ECF subfamily)
MSDSGSSHLERCLERFRNGDRAASDELLSRTCERLSQLARLMLKGYPRLRRWEETGDVVQSAVLRLARALETVKPPTLRDYYRLAALQIRRELLDLVRHHYGPLGKAAWHQSAAGEGDSGTPAYERPASTNDPGRLALWSEFHRQVQMLPEEEQEVFDLLYYQGMSHVEAAELLGVAARTVKRRWQAACLKLHEALGGELPGA